MSTESEGASRTFRAMVEGADRKFARVRDLPAYGRAASHQRSFQKVFKAYTRLWRFQQENRARLVEAGLNRWEIGEIASRIGQLYFGQYMRTSEARFLVEAYVFYEAILSRRYFDFDSGGGSKGRDLGVRFKELRFYARFLLVSLILNRTEMVKALLERFQAVVDESKSSFREANFKEWKQVVQEMVRFMKVDTAFVNARPLRYCVMFDSHPASLPYVARFHAKKVLKFRDALLTSYHQNEVKFAEITLDTFRMMQCLEWEPSGPFYQKRLVESNENGAFIDHSAASGIIDMNLAADMTDSTLPPNPKKAVLYRPSVTHLIAVLATICEELPSDSVMLIYLSASGKASSHGNVSLSGSSSGSGKSSKSKVMSQNSHGENGSIPSSNEKVGLNKFYESYLWFGSKGNAGSNNLYPGDLIPFTRRPLFLVIDSDNSHAFKADAVCYEYGIRCVKGVDNLLVEFLTQGSTFQVLHGAERGEAAALLLSPSRPTFKNPSGVDITHNGSQFTFFLTAPLQAFISMVDLSYSDIDPDVCEKAENILSNVFSEWEVILCTSTSLDLVWAQVLSDPFIRRLILRFIFCRSALSTFCHSEDKDQYLPLCLPHLPDAVSPDSEPVQTAIRRLATHLRVSDSFRFH